MPLLLVSSNMNFPNQHSSSFRDGGWASPKTSFHLPVVNCAPSCVFAQVLGLLSLLLSCFPQQ